MYESADSPSLPSPHAALPDTIETFADQVLLITWLSHQFCLTCVVEQIPAGRSYAYVTSRRIALSDTALPLGRQAVCLHEFAHLIAEQRARGEGHKHGRLFCEALWDVVQAVGLPHEHYPWGAEYRTVGRQWRRWLKTRARRRTLPS